MTTDIVILSVSSKDSSNYRKTDKKMMSVLLVKRDTFPYKGKWCLPGGFLNPKEETLEECAIRELKEETNINVNDLELITVLSGKEYYFKYPNEDELDCVIALYKVSNYEGELNINDGESKELKFFSLDNLPELESRAKTIIDKIKSGIIKL